MVLFQELYTLAIHLQLVTFVESLTLATAQAHLMRFGGVDPPRHAMAVMCSA